MKISVVSDGAGWVLDSIRNDYKKHTRHEVLPDGDIKWLVNYWSLPNYVHQENVVVQLHHVSRQHIEKYDFNAINKCKACIVPNEITKSFIQDKVNIPVEKLPYWLLSGMMKEVKDRSRIDQIRQGGKLIIGSFQKDGESRTGKPKLVKGPDRLLEIVKKINLHKPVKMILAGYDRDYVISNLEKMGIEYEYFRKDSDIVDLYESLDWYLVTSRDEGGPQAVLEAAYRKVNILSTPVGMAPEVLHEQCICDEVDDFVDIILSDRAVGIDYNYKNVMEKYIPNVVIPRYDDFFQNLLIGRR